ncbi:ClpP/crotonase [Coprinopsis marcescibilis]|uniref:ClpP/crotonase n=1 Tax=Coprinopsis marcescibilis TaxID=230819 RepID=A0A5C3LB32_COPMA|nr:ClpP/crotonase [Coprinopsis marcescibilis]
MSSATESTISVHIADKVAILTLDRPQTLNALTPSDYDKLSNSLREIDSRDDVLVTILQGNGQWFCSGTDVRSKKPTDDVKTGNLRETFRTSVTSTTIDVGQALYSHSKILVAALNGPVMAFIGYFDFIYALPGVWLSCPFTFIGIVAEGGASVTFVNRMGVGMAKEVLIWGKKKNSQQLLDAGFINQIYPAQSTEEFHSAVRRDVLADLDGLDPTALLKMKSLIQVGLNDKNNMDAVNLREGYAQAARLASGIPARQFRRIANKEIRHKL